MSRFHDLTINDIRQETPTTVSLSFSVPDELAEQFHFTQGQYLTLRADVNGEDLRRSYSICSGVGDTDLRVAVKKVENGRFSTFVNDGLSVGDTIAVMQPEGRFNVPLEAEADRNYLALASGSGITPLLSIIKTTLAAEPNSHFTLFYGNRNSNEIIFHEELEELKDRYLERLTVYYILSREGNDIDLLSGRLDDEKIRTLMKTCVPVAEIDHAFICGPGGMIDTAETILRELGMPSEKIHFERFTMEGEAPRVAERKQELAQNGEEAQAELVLDGQRLMMSMKPGETVLDAAEREGLDVPYSCRAGMCCTCRCKVVEGEAEMLVNYSLEDWEVEADYVLGCQSVAKSDRLVLDFDQV